MVKLNKKEFKKLNMSYNSIHIRELMKSGNIQLSIILVALHIERILAMTIELYYRPQNVRPMINKLDFYNIIEICKELKIFKRTHWYEHFHNIRKLRNKIAHNFDYWELLDKDSKERKKAETICINNIKFMEIPIPHMLSKEINPIVAKNTREFFQKMIESIKKVWNL